MLIRDVESGAAAQLSGPTEAVPTIAILARFQG